MKLKIFLSFLFFASLTFSFAHETTTTVIETYKTEEQIATEKATLESQLQSQKDKLATQKKLERERKNAQDKLEKEQRKLAKQQKS
jgi:Skp family chaperone for outer membrane proteins